MTDLDRDRLIALFGRLDAADDQGALAAGREIAKLVKDSGATWDELLAPGPRAAADAGADETGSDGPAADAPGGALAPEEAAEARGLIAALLAMSHISDSTREDIEGLRGDLGEGRFERSDLRYLKALRARLS